MSSPQQTSAAARPASAGPQPIQPSHGLSATGPDIDIPHCDTKPRPRRARTAKKGSTSRDWIFSTGSIASTGISTSPSSWGPSNGRAAGRWIASLFGRCGRGELLPALLKLRS